MRASLPAAAVLAAQLTICPALADTALPRLQPPEPVFEEHDLKYRPSVCNGFAGYAATIEQTVQEALVDPLVSIAEDLARLFRPLFTDDQSTSERPQKRLTARKLKPQSPSAVIRTAERKRLCG